MADMGEQVDRTGALREAERLLRESLNTPSNKLPFHWYSANISGREIIDINMIYPLVCAWCEIDVAIAESILKGVFFLQDKDGSIASRYLTDGTPLTDEAPWPLILKAVRKVWDHGGNEEFIGRIAPRLYRYVDWICFHFDKDQQGRLEWSSKEESLIPDFFKPGISAPDLCILIASEIEELLYFEGECPKSFSQNLDIQPEYDKFVDLLQGRCWNREEEEVCFRGAAAAEPLKAPLFYTALMSLCLKVSPELRLQIKPKLIRCLNDMMAPEVLPGRDDGQINIIHLFLVIAAAQVSGVTFDLIKYCETVSKAAEDHFDRTRVLPESLDAVMFGDDLPANLVPCNQLMMSALVVYVNSVLPDQSNRRIAYHHPLVQKINRHLNLAVGMPIATALLIVLTVALVTVRRQDPTLSVLETSLGLAEKNYQVGEYEEALKITEQYLDESVDFVAPHLLRARILFRLERYEEAKSVYEDLLQREMVHPSFRLNLGVVHYRQNNFEEAIEVYRSFIEQYGDALPLDAARARHAIHLLENRSVSLPRAYDLEQ